MQFTITPDILKKINEWKKTLKDQDNHGGAIGGRFTYSFTVTSIGTVIKVFDNVTGEEKDFTDYSDW